MKTNLSPLKFLKTYSKNNLINNLIFLILKIYKNKLKKNKLMLFIMILLKEFIIKSVIRFKQKYKKCKKEKLNYKKKKILNKLLLILKIF